jgi:hypothetical protein
MSFVDRVALHQDVLGSLGQCAPPEGAFHVVVLRDRRRTMIGVDQNSTIMFPAPLMTTIQELSAFMGREAATAGEQVGVTAAAHRNGAIV